MNSIESDLNDAVKEVMRTLEKLKLIKDRRDGIKI